MKDLIKNNKSKKRSPLYIPWYQADEDIIEEDNENGWVSYVRRNMSHTSGESSPFPDSSWSYNQRDNIFEELEDGHISDEKIHTEVMNSLYENEGLDASHIKTLVLNGLVSLFGNVKTLSEKKEAEKIIRYLDGVWSVRNELQVVTEQPQGGYHAH